MALSAEQVDELIGDRWVFEFDKDSEMEILRSLDEYLPANGVFWDIGSHAGMYSIVAAQIYDELDIYCFEPSEITREKALEGNLEELDNTSVVPYPLADSQGTVTYRESGRGQTNNSLATAPIEPDDHEKVSIEAHTARSAVEELDIPEPDALKIDVEGAEARVLDGFDADLMENVQVVLVELHHINRTDTETVETLEDFGFDIEVLDERDTGENRRQEHILATKS
jgi:FkbM family methyltransferase